MSDITLDGRLEHDSMSNNALIESFLAWMEVNGVTFNGYARAWPDDADKELPSDAYLHGKCLPGYWRRALEGRG